MRPLLKVALVLCAVAAALEGLVIGTVELQQRWPQGELGFALAGAAIGFSVVCASTLAVVAIAAGEWR